MAVTDEMKIRAWDSFVREYKGNHVTEGMICRAVEAALSLSADSRAEAIGECIETVKGVFDCMATTTVGSAQYEVVRALRALLQKEGE